MVAAVIDPIRVPTITMSQAELAEMEELIETGQLPRDFIEKHFRAVQANVFGHDHKTDRHGNPIEQGIGSPGNMTRNCVEAYRKYGKGEDGYTEHLALMEKQLKECDARRAAERAKAKSKKRAA